MDDVEAVATRIVGQLESGDVAAVWAQLAEGVQKAVSVDALQSVAAGFDRSVGSSRVVTDACKVSDAPPAARVILRGELGKLAISLRFDEQERVAGFGMVPWRPDGIRNIVIGSPMGRWDDEKQRAEGEPRELGEFYAEVLGMRIIRDDWIKVGKGPTEFPHLAFGDGWSDGYEPRWPDPEHPQQLHIDVFVPDLQGAEQRVLERGATKLQDKGDYRSYADPFGHPFCLYADPDAPGAGQLGRVMLDCFSPRSLAGFYAELLDMPDVVEDSPERVVIRRSDGVLPMLGFQHVANYKPPRWHDPARPEQVHLDLSFYDPPKARDLAERLGAIRLPPPHGSGPVFADPAGHPFCLCSPEGGEY